MAARPVNRVFFLSFFSFSLNCCCPALDTHVIKVRPWTFVPKIRGSGPPTVVTPTFVAKFSSKNGQGPRYDVQVGSPDEEDQGRVPKPRQRES